MPSSSDVGHINRILFIRLSAVGDVINTLPTLAALRAGLPKAFIGFAVEDRVRDLIQGHPHVDRVHLYPRKRWVRWLKNPVYWGKLITEATAFMSQLRSNRYDVALDLQGNIKGGLHGLLSGARVRFGFDRDNVKELNHLFNHRHVTPPAEPVHRVDKFLSMASALGVHVNGTRYGLPESPESLERLRGWLDEHGLSESRYVAIHPGTSVFGKQKRWMPERFAEVAKRIHRKYRIPCVVTWGPGELELAEEVVEQSGGRAVLALQTRSLLDLAEVLRRSRLYIGCDSGPLHLASAVGVPSIALFGPKDPKVYGPRSPVHRVVYKPGSNGSGSTMEAITVDDVSSAVEDVLS